MALVIGDVCFCQVPRQVALENRDKYAVTFQKGSDTWQKSNRKQTFITAQNLGPYHQVQNISAFQHYTRSKKYPSVDGVVTGKYHSIWPRG